MGDGNNSIINQLYDKWDKLDEWERFDSRVSRVQVYLKDIHEEIDELLKMLRALKWKEIWDDEE